MMIFYLCVILPCILAKSGETSSSTSTSNAFYIDFKNLDEYNPPQDGVKIEVNSIISLKSLCLRFSISDDPFQTIVFSKDFHLAFDFDDYHGYFSLNGVDLIFSTPYIPVPNNNFEHFCFSHNKTHYIVASQGVLWFNHTLFPKEREQVNKPSEIDIIEFGPMPSSHDYGGSYFDGKVSELYIYSNSFTTEELIEITRNCTRYEKYNEMGTKVFEWSKIESSSVKIPQNSNINIVKIKDDYFCLELSSKILGYIPFPLDIHSANTACIAWGGKLNLPDNEEELELMKNMTVGEDDLVKNFTKDRQMCGNRVWLPIQKSENLNYWVDYNNHSNTVIPLSPMDLDGLFLQTCASNVPIGSNKFDDVSCSKKICAFCEWKSRPSFQLRGLCGKSKIEDRYVLSTEYFEGFLGIRFIYKALEG